MNQYFTNDPNLEHDEHTFDFTLFGHNLQFTADNGVFSKHTVDYGSRVLLEALSEEALPAGPILDVGCGYGPIGLALAKAFPKEQVTLSDVNERALALAKRNAEANQIANATILTSDQYDRIDGQFALVVTNPPIRAGKAVVSGILAGAKDHLLPGGKLVAVIRKKQGAPSALKLMKATYSSAEIIKKDAGYYILQASL